MANEKEKMVTIKLPRVKGEDVAFASVNERTWYIPRGKEIEVPACVAYVFEEREKRLDIAYDYDTSVQH